ncbi:kinase-like domain-containing protein [Gigaspora rosea]|uniref:Kinase-like domain-containing protein n=1 Tax=Gigaspora rosea TaxID=44941 RepID=A0A397U9D4_9GLOM|nr:kinase-like domain-containing protein [Gigaspora rosea]
MNQSEDLIQKCLDEERIKFYEYYRFEDFKLIGEGGFGKVYRATFKNNEISVAIKSFKSNVPIKEIVKELKLHCKADIHSNIIRLLGVTKNKDNTDSSSTHYMLVLEYADSGTLRLLVQSNACEEIIHRDLHSTNILVHDKRIKLTDFGLSKRLGEATNSSLNFFGVIPYMDPQSFISSRNKNRSLKFNKKSDIYSVGVLMWEISSGYPPFQDDSEHHLALMLDISNGVREIPVEGSPQEYIKIYTDLRFDNGQVTNTIAQNSNALKTQKSILVNQDYQSRADLSLIIPDSVLKQNATSSLSYNDKMGENEKKFLKLNKSLEIDSNNAITLRERGIAHRMMNKYEESLADLNKSLEIDPNNAITLRERGATYRMMNEYEESLTDLNKSLEIDPNDAITLSERGATYGVMNKFEESLADLNKSLESIQTMQLHYATTRGITYRITNRYEESLADLNKSLEIDSNNAITLCNRGITYCMMNRYKESLADLNKPLEIDSNNVVALRERGITYRLMNKYEESLADLNKSLEIDPNNTITLNEQALAYLNKSLEIIPNNTFASNERGMVYRTINKYEESLADLNKSLEIDPKDVIALKEREKTYMMIYNRT